jgi:tetratricopeptide (TPR) repeat protein
VSRYRLALIPVGALVVALLSYGLGAGFGAAEPFAEPAAVVDNPVAEPAVPADGAAVLVRGSTDTDRRIAFWQDRIKAIPDSDVQYQYLGELLSQKGRETGDVTQYALATEAFERAIELYPGNATARTGLAVTLVTMHQWTDAIEQATVILEADPRAKGAVAVIGDASLEIGDLETAEAAFETLRRIAGGPSVDSRFARLAFLRGDTVSAIRILDEAARAAVELNRSPEEIAFYHYSAGDYRLTHGDIAGAEGSFDAALVALPEYYLAVAGGGRAAFARGDIPAAIDAYRSAVAIIPKAELIAYLGDLHAIAGDEVEAERQYRAVDFIAELNDLQADVSNREIALFQASHRRDTGHAVRLAEAELEVRKDIYGFDALAWARFNDGQVAQALAPARRAMALGTRDARLLYHLGAIEMANGLDTEGREHLRDALTLNPAFDPLGVLTARELLGGS